MSWYLNKIFYLALYVNLRINFGRGGAMKNFGLQQGGGLQNFEGLQMWGHEKK